MKNRNSPPMGRGDSCLEHKSPVMHRSPNNLTKRATMISMRKLTNSLFDENALMSQVIKEEGGGDQDSQHGRK